MYCPAFRLVAFPGLFLPLSCLDLSCLGTPRRPIRRRDAGRRPFARRSPPGRHDRNGSGGSEPGWRRRRRVGCPPRRLAAPPAISLPLRRRPHLCLDLHLGLPPTSTPPSRRLVPLRVTPPPRQPKPSLPLELLALPRKTPRCPPSSLPLNPCYSVT